MPLCFSRITYLSFGLKLRGKSNAIKRQSLQLWKFLTDNNARWTIDRVNLGYIVFAGRKHQKIINIEVMMLMNVIGESVKFVGKYVYLGKLYKSSRSYENRVNKHVVISLNFPCLIASLLSCLLMSFFLFVLWLGFV